MYSGRCVEKLQFLPYFLALDVASTECELSATLWSVVGQRKGETAVTKGTNNAQVGPFVAEYNKCSAKNSNDNQL